MARASRKDTEADDPLPSVASVAYHGVRAARRELGAQTLAANACAALESVRALARDVAAGVLWPFLKHSGRRGSALLGPRATHAAVG